MDKNNKIKIPLWRFIVPFLLQLIVILSIPSQSFYTYAFGETIVIQTRPVDPYDVLRGYSQTLRYDISDLNELKQLPGGKDLEQAKTFYVILKAPESQDQQPPLPWIPSKIRIEKPQNLPDNEIAIAGTVENSRWANYGLETYYMPENIREQINREIRQLQQQSNRERSFVVEIKVDAQGNAIASSLWIGDRNYNF